jgi:Zn-finger protein
MLESPDSSLFSPKGEPTFADVLDELESNWGPCVALYVHGSVLWQNKSPADIDLLAVVDEPTLRPIFSASVDSQFKLGKFEVSVYSRSFWLQKLALMDITMLTCLSLPAKFVLHEAKHFLEEVHSVRVRPLQLLESSHAYAEYTWVKARILLQGGDVHKSCKNVSNAFRLLEIAAQILEHDRISDFHAANVWWERSFRAYNDFSIEATDWDMVEALFARSFQQELVRVHKLAIATEPCSSRPVPQLLESSSEECSLCICPFYPVEGGSFTQSHVVLPRCGHKLCSKCALGHCRAATTVAKCPQCSAPWRLDLEKDLVFKRDAELRGTREWQRVTRRRHRVPVGPVEPVDPAEAAPERTIAALQHAFDIESQAFKKTFEEVREARRSTRPEVIAASLRENCSYMKPYQMFGGYPATLLLENEMGEQESLEAIPNIVIAMHYGDDGAVGTNMSGDEVFKLPLAPIDQVGELVADAMGFHVAAVEVIFEDSLPTIVILSPSIDWTSKYREERYRRNCEYDCLAVMRDELAERRWRIREELQAAKLELRTWESELRCEGYRAWKAGLVRMLGFTSRRQKSEKSQTSFLGSLSQKSDVAEQRSRSRRKSKQRLANLATKELRTSRRIQRSHFGRDVGSKPKGRALRDRYGWGNFCDDL